MAKRKSSENEPEVPAFEHSLAELQTIVSDLEDGSLGLESSLARFEKGIGLLRTCYSILESAEARVEVLTRFNGEAPPDVAPFDTTATFQPGNDAVKIDDVDDAADDTKSSLF